MTEVDSLAREKISGEKTTKITGLFRTILNQDHPPTYNDMLAVVGSYAEISGDKALGECIEKAIRYFDWDRISTLKPPQRKEVFVKGSSVYKVDDFPARMSEIVDPKVIEGMKKLAKELLRNQRTIKNLIEASNDSCMFFQFFLKEARHKKQKFTLQF